MQEIEEYKAEIEQLKRDNIIYETKLREKEKQYEEMRQENDNCYIVMLKGKNDMIKHMEKEIEQLKEENKELLNHIRFLEGRLKVAHRLSPEEQYKGSQRGVETIKKAAKKDGLNIATYINYKIIAYPDTNRIDLQLLMKDTGLQRSVIYDFIRELKEGNEVEKYSMFPCFIGWVQKGGKFKNTKSKK